MARVYCGKHFLMAIFSCLSEFTDEMKLLLLLPSDLGRLDWCAVVFIWLEAGLRPIHDRVIRPQIKGRSPEPSPPPLRASLTSVHSPKYLHHATSMDRDYVKCLRTLSCNRKLPKVYR